MRPDLFQPEVETGALFSPCRTWRYSLYRIWNKALPALVMVMLNPSTAEETANDPTVERCQRRAVQMDCGTLIVVNAFALRSTDPDALKPHADPVGPDNDKHISIAAYRSAAGTGGFLICGWGKECELARPGRARQVLDLIRAQGATPLALKVNKDGSPQHPLYVGYSVQPTEYRL